MFALKWNDSYNFPKMEVKTMLLRIQETKANYVVNFSNLPILVQMYFWSTWFIFNRVIHSDVKKQFGSWSKR